MRTMKLLVVHYVFDYFYRFEGAVPINMSSLI